MAFLLGSFYKLADRVLDEASTREPDKPKPSESAGCAWLPWLGLITMLLLLYFGCVPVHNVVDTTARAFVEAVREEIAPPQAGVDKDDSSDWLDDDVDSEEPSEERT